MAHTDVNKSYPCLLVRKNLLPRYWHTTSRLGYCGNSTSTPNDKYALMDGQICHRILHYWQQNDLQQAMENGQMPSLWTPTRNHSPYTPVPWCQVTNPVGWLNPPTLKHPAPGWHPSIIEDLSASGLNSWRHQAQPSMAITLASKAWTTLTWDNFVHGFISISWKHQQVNYYASKNNPSSTSQSPMQYLQGILQAMGT